MKRSAVRATLKVPPSASTLRLAPGRPSPEEKTAESLASGPFHGPARPARPARGGSAVSPEVLDPVIHAQARLRIVAALAVIPAGDEIVFPRLRELLSMTAGNLSTHLSKLEAAGYVSQSKTFSGRTPATYIALTPRGRLAFEEYTRTLRAMLDAAGQ